MSQENERTITTDTDGVIRHWGRDWENVLGFTSEEALGRKVDLIIPPVLQARHWRGFNKAIETGRLRRPDATLKVPGVHKNGEIIPLRSTLAISHGDDGTADGVVSTLSGRGPAWRGTAWRAVLAPLKLGQVVRGRTGRSETVRGVRIALPPVSDRASQRRTLDEHVFVHFPALYRVLAGVFWRLTRRSRLRRLIVAYSIQRGYAALNRRDFDVVLMRSDPGVEYRPGGDLMPPDLEAVFYGHDGYRKLWRRWFDAFEDLRWEPKEMLDFGDRLLVTAELRGHGSGSGVAVSEPAFQLFKIRGGLSISQEDFTDRDRALEAAGLRE